MPRWNNLGDLIDRSRNLDRTAVIDLRRPESPLVLTHADVDGLANGVARLLTDAGLPG